MNLHQIILNMIPETLIKPRPVLRLSLPRRFVLCVEKSVFFDLSIVRFGDIISIRTTVDGSGYPGIRV